MTIILRAFTLPKLRTIENVTFSMELELEFPLAPPPPVSVIAILNIALELICPSSCASGKHEPHAVILFQ